MESKNEAIPAQKTPKDRQEIGVCGTGKHRVINAVALPLTPATAPNFQSGYMKIKESKKKRVKTDLDHSLRNPYVITGSSNYARKSTGSTSSIAGSDVSGISSVAESDHHMSDGATGNHVGFKPDMKDRFPSVGEVKEAEKRLHNRSSLLGKRERVIEISPSLRLPVTPMPSGSGSLSSIACDPGDTVRRENASERGTIGFPANMSSVSSSRTSLSDLTSLGLSVSEDLDNISMISEQSCNQAGSGNSFVDLQMESERLKDALKMAEADIAILVSAKQQLQLDFHHEQEKVKVMSRHALDAEDKERNFETTIEHLKASLQEQEERSNLEIERCQAEVLISKSEIAEKQNTLGIVTADRDAKDLKIQHLQREVANHEAQIKGYEQKVVELSAKNVDLEDILQDTAAKREGKESFIKLLTQQKNDAIKRFQEREGAINMLEITNKTLEAKIVDLQHANQRLVEKSETSETRFREIDSENVILSGKLRMASKEKLELNSAVRRLRTDITHVENSFSKLKQQLLEKTQLAEQESSRNTDLVERVKSLTSQVTKLDNVNAETRIRDKNVQIEQLLSMSKVSSSEKTRLEKQLLNLQEHIASNEKSWVEAVEREKKTSRVLKEKDDLIRQKYDEIARLSASLEKEQRRVAEMTQNEKLCKEELEQLKIKFAESKKQVEAVTTEKSIVSNTVELLRKNLRQESEAKSSNEVLHREESAKQQERIQELNDKVDMLQKKLVSGSERLRLVEEDLQKTEVSKGEHEDHNIQQMEILSELQSARRVLLQEKDSLALENSTLRTNIDALKTEICDSEGKFVKEKTMFEEQTRKLESVAKAEKADLRSEIESLHEKLKQIEMSKLATEGEIATVKDHSNVLSQRLEALQIHDGQLAKALEDKIRENKAVTSEQQVTKEELNVLKKEFSKVTEQLVNSLQEKEVRQEEQNILKNAVLRQQQYCVSLQKHYEKWAKDVEIQMKSEVARYKRNLRSTDRERYKFSHSDSQDRVPESDPARLLKDNVLYPEDEIVRQIEENILEEPTEVAYSLETVQQCSLENTNLGENGDGGKEISAQENILEMVDASVQTCLYDEYAISCQISSFNSETEALVREKLSLMEENTQQAELIAELEERIQNWSMSDTPAIANTSTQTLHEEDSFLSLLDTPLDGMDCSTQTSYDDELLPVMSDTPLVRPVIKESVISSDCSTQTLHDEDLLPVLSDTQAVESVIPKLTAVTDSSTQTLHDEELVPMPLDTTPTPLLEDASSQTEHDSEPVGHRYVAQVEEELSAFKEVSEHKIFDLQQENTFLRNQVQGLNKQLEDLQDSRSSLLEDSSTQTSHDEDPVTCSFSSNPRHEVSSTLLEDSSTQTDHDTDVVSQRVQSEVLKNDELGNTEDEVEKLSLELQNAIMENKRLLAAIIDCEKFFSKKEDAYPLQTSAVDDTATVPKSPCTITDASCQTDGYQRLLPANPSLPEAAATDENPLSLDSELPSPMLILRTMESKKLKAYKKTVHLMKKKLEAAEEKIANLQTEMKFVSQTAPNSSVENKNSDAMLKMLQEELLQAKKASFILEEDYKRKALADKRISDSRSSVMLEKVSSLTTANERLRSSVEVLQVKLTEKSRQCSTALREKCRYQMRARRLQASLRSLAWINGNQDGVLTEIPVNESVSDDSLVFEDLTENVPSGPQGDSGNPRRSNSIRTSLSLPASVVEVEASLKDLQSEIVALEKQMQEHSTAVRQSKSQWTRLKEESKVLSSPQQTTAKSAKTSVTLSNHTFKVV